MIKRTLLFFLLIIPAIGFGQEPVSISTSGPKLMWEKRFPEKILSAFMSKNGQYMAVTDGSGFLFYFDKSGKELWKFKYAGKLKTKQEFKSGKPPYIISNVTISDDGKYIAATLRGLYTWRQRVQDIETRLYSDDKFEAHYPQKVIYLDFSGKLLWEFEARGTAQMSSDGGYVFVIPWEEEGGETLGKYYLIDKSGALLWAHGDKREARGGISRDGRYVFVRNLIYDAGHNLVKRFGKFDLVDSINENGIVVMEYVADDPPNTPVGLSLYNSGTKKLFTLTEADPYLRKGHPFQSCVVSGKLLVLPQEGECSSLKPGDPGICEMGWGAYDRTGRMVHRFAHRSRDRLTPKLITSDNKMLLARNWHDRQFVFFEISSAKQIWRITMPEGFYSALSPDLSSLVSGDGEYFIAVFEKNIRFYDNSEYVK